MALTLNDKKYIDNSVNTAVNRARIEFRDEIKPFFEDLMQQNKNHMTALQEQSREELKLLNEIHQDRPTRSEINKKFEELKWEINGIRTQTNDHEDRITYLEKRSTK